MKKYIFAIGFFCFMPQVNALTFSDAFNSAKSFLSKKADSILEKGKKYLMENSDEIFEKVKENAGPLFEQAKALFKEKAEQEKVSSAQEIMAQANNIIAMHKKEFTAQEQQALVKEAQAIVQKNNEELTRVSLRLQGEKRENLSQSIRQKYAL